MKIAVCMIVKNSERTIRKCLASFRPFVQEVNVYDTGSTDNTVKILRQLASRPGAPIRVKRGEWRDDFAWARNQAYEMCSLDVNWTLCVDDDDTVIGAENLPALVQASPELYGYLVPYDRGAFWEWPLRLVRHQRGDQWCYPIHEQWIPKDETARSRSQRLAPEVFRLVHSQHEGSPERNIRILQRQVDGAYEQGEQPEPRTLAFLGLELALAGRQDEAVGWLGEYVSVGGDDGKRGFYEMAAGLCDQGLLPAATVVSMHDLKGD
jgi:hypothetical protein